MDAVDGFYAGQPFVDWCKTTHDEGHFQHFSEKIVFLIWRLSILGILPCEKG